MCCIKEKCTRQRMIHSGIIINRLSSIIISFSHSFHTFIYNYIYNYSYKKSHKDKKMQSSQFSNLEFEIFLRLWIEFAKLFCTTELILLVNCGILWIYGNFKNSKNSQKADNMQKHIKHPKYNTFYYIL